ncbi:MAG: protein kinase [candidate division Zixibacteria bacterium]|nr:protein kinase [candidate division Zixibacteria bacterium]
MKPGERIGKIILERNIFVGDLTEAWLGSCEETGNLRFIKTPVPDSSEVTAKILKESFDGQASLYSTGILRANSIYFKDGRLFIEYPYIDTTIWTELTPEILLDFPIPTITQMSLIIDYIHLMGLVHRDIKLSNFLVNTTTKQPVVILTDLDFLCSVNSPSKAKIMGTPAHIAPEILGNYRAVAESDNYSLGISLKFAIEQIEQREAYNHKSKATLLKGINNLVLELIQQSIYRRPHYLTKALLVNGIVDKTDYSDILKRLFAMVILSKYWNSDRNNLNNSKKMAGFLRTQCKIIYLHQDFVDLLSETYEQSRVGALRIIKLLILNSDLKLTADYWHLNIDDDNLLKIYLKLEESSKRNLYGDRDKDHELI